MNWRRTSKGIWRSGVYMITADRHDPFGIYYTAWDCSGEVPKQLAGYWGESADKAKAACEGEGR